MTAPLRLGLVGPVPPPNGGMAMQTRQLARLLAREGVQVELVATNAPYRPGFIGRLKGIRALFRLLPYLWRGWRLAGRVDVIHLMANSGWSWQLFSAPVIWIGWLRGTPVIVNYRGGEAREYLQKSAARVLPTLGRARRVVVPSGFLEQVFADFDVRARVIPNIIDLETFHPARSATSGQESRAQGEYVVVITRNLEPIYGLETAIHCIAQVRAAIPGIVLKIAGSGPQLARLQDLSVRLGVQDRVFFLGRLERPEVVALYQSADVMLNPALVDNMPNSVLEALACGVPVISTNVGGVPFLVENGSTALLVEPGDADAMAAALTNLHADRALAGRLVQAGIELVRRFAWPVVKEQWLALYRAEVPAT
ncbi:MAG: glycosyltransferase family 4 protein [Halioglobus sp.]